MTEFVVTLVCTLVGTLIGWFFDSLLIGGFIGFICGLALSFGCPDLLEAIGDALSDIDFGDGGGGDWGGGGDCGGGE